MVPQGAGHEGLTPLRVRQLILSAPAINMWNCCCLLLLVILTKSIKRTCLTGCGLMFGNSLVVDTSAVMEGVLLASLARRSESLKGEEGREGDNA